MKKNTLFFAIFFFGLLVWTLFPNGTSMADTSELRIAIDFDMTEVDPAKLRTSTDRLLVVNIYNGLLKFKPESCEIQNDLA